MNTLLFGNTLLFSISLLFLGCVWLLRTRLLLPTVKRVRGAVIAFEIHKDSNSDTLYTPVFQFIDFTGKLVIAKDARGGSTSKRHHVGQRLKLVYNPSKPHEVCHDKVVQAWFAPALCWLTGSVLLVQALV